eukprot:COSAG05_NODE_410_length_10109_cov_29.470430_3_plen_108_part_00
MPGGSKGDALCASVRDYIVMGADCSDEQDEPSPRQQELQCEVKPGQQQQQAHAAEERHPMAEREQPEPAILPCVFVDDDITELCDPALKNAAAAGFSLYRVLFTRVV